MSPWPAFWWPKFVEFLGNPIDLIVWHHRNLETSSHSDWKLRGEVLRIKSISKRSKWGQVSMWCMWRVNTCMWCYVNVRTKSDSNWTHFTSSLSPRRYTIPPNNSIYSSSTAPMRVRSLAYNQGILANLFFKNFGITFQKAKWTQDNIWDENDTICKKIDVVEWTKTVQNHER